MPVLLEELYAEVNKNEIHLIAGAAGMNQVVEWIHMVENIEISTFLDGGEIVFVTGIGLNNMNELMVLVEEVNRHHVSGIVINVGPYIHKIPREIIEYCNKEALPLFEVPWSVHMARIMRQFCMKITEADRSELELVSAIKNAIYFPRQAELYMPFFKIHGLSKNAAYAAALLNIGCLEPSVQKNLLRKLQNRLRNFFLFRQLKVEVLILENRLLLLFIQHDESLLQAQLHEIKERFLADMEPYSINIGVGSIVHHAENICRSYQQAGEVLRLQERRKKANTLDNYADLGIYQLLLGVENRSILKKYFHETLEPLEKYDAVNNTAYLALLAEYLETNGSVKAIAEKRFVHRNTINYQIHKIEEILGCDLSSMECRVKLVIALKVKDIL